MALLDQKEIANIITKEFFAQFLTLDGLNSGVPTRTTPTLTPTTLRNIEQTFIELTESHQNEAGFVPPLVHSIGNNQYVSESDVVVPLSSKTANVWQPSSISQSSSDSNSRPTPPLTPASDITNSSTTTTTTTRRNMGGRKPSKPMNMSPEEEARRVQRRERNKMAAARCRKRRVDHTNQLINETDALEMRKQQLQQEIQSLQTDRDELQFILDTHRACCRLQTQNNGIQRPGSPPDIKPYVFPLLENKNLESEPRVKTEMVEQIPTTLSDNILFSEPPAKKVMLNSMAPTLPSINKPNRPSSLNVPTTFIPSQKTTSVSDAIGIPITTPSTGIPFNFESLMDGGTGLTPVSAPLVPSCSSQQRNLPAPDLSSPDAGGPPKLVSL